MRIVITERSAQINEQMLSTVQPFNYDYNVIYNLQKFMNSETAIVEPPTPVPRPIKFILNHHQPRSDQQILPNISSPNLKPFHRFPPSRDFRRQSPKLSVLAFLSKQAINMFR